MGRRCSGLGLGLGGGGEVAGGGRLVDGKVEAGYDGVEVVEDVGLKLLEGLPACAGCEEVELQGNALRCGLELSRHQGEVGSTGASMQNLGIVLEVSLDVTAE